MISAWSVKVQWENYGKSPKTGSELGAFLIGLLGRWFARDGRIRAYLFKEKLSAGRTPGMVSGAAPSLPPNDAGFLGSHRSDPSLFQFLFRTVALYFFFPALLAACFVSFVPLLFLLLDSGGRGANAAAADSRQEWQTGLSESTFETAHGK